MTVNPLLIPGGMEVVIIVIIAVFLFPGVIVWAAKRAGVTVGRIRHADDDVRDGLDDVE